MGPIFSVFSCLYMARVCSGTSQCTLGKKVNRDSTAVLGGDFSSCAKATEANVEQIGLSTKSDTWEKVPTSRLSADFVRGKQREFFIELRASALPFTTHLNQGDFLRSSPAKKH